MNTHIIEEQNRPMRLLAIFLPCSVWWRGATFASGMFRPAPGMPDRLALDWPSCFRSPPIPFATGRRRTAGGHRGWRRCWS